MEKELICDCKKADFLNFGAYLRCNHCYTEYKFFGSGMNRKMKKRKINEDGSYPEVWDDLT